MTATQPSPAHLVRLLRQHLSRFDRKDIADDYGERSSTGFALYERFVDQVGADGVIHALVGDAIQRDILPLLLEVIIDWRRDLANSIEALPQVMPEQAKANLRTVNLITGNKVYIVSDAGDNGD